MSKTNGDLISREALIREACIKFYTTPYYKHILDLINNAPTVAVNCKECDGYEAGYSAGLNDAEIPQGEWSMRDEYVGGEYVTSFYHINCPCDDLETPFYLKRKTRFCPNCGTPMKKG